MLYNPALSEFITTKEGLESVLGRPVPTGTR